MTELESLAKLRTMMEQPSTWPLDKRVDAIADEIQAEVDSRYMELPVDADGVPVHVGDQMLVNVNGCKQPYKVLALSDSCFTVKRGNEKLVCTANSHRHAKPRTVDDVLVELLASCGKPTLNAYDERAIKKYAAELQMKGGE